jgi:hypothetical protein
MPTVMRGRRRKGVAAHVKHPDGDEEDDACSVIKVGEGEGCLL